MPDCKNETFENLDKCALHCSYNDINRRKNLDYESTFRNEFHQYILNKIKKFNRHKEENSEEEKKIRNGIINNIKNINKGFIDKNIELNKILEDNEVCIENIEFPVFIDEYLCGYGYVLKNVGKVFFKKCKFYNICKSEDSNIFYEYCLFLDKLNIYADSIFNEDDEFSLKVNAGDRDYRYNRCIFNKDVSIENYKNINLITYNIFDRCEFKKDVSIKKVKVAKIFLNIPEYKKEGGIIEEYEVADYEEKEEINNIFTFKKISIYECEFFYKFKINGIGKYDKKKYLQSKNRGGDSLHIPSLEIKSLKIEDTKFKSKFEVKNATLEKMEFYDSNVEGIFDISECRIKKANFYKSIFEEFAVFSNVYFGDDTEKNITDFTNTTFKEFSSFREANFTSGLRFSQANTKQEPNFLNADINTKYTDRETLRIIKNSFEKVNNKIEANKFFISEMKYY